MLRWEAQATRIYSSSLSFELFYSLALVYLAVIYFSNNLLSLFKQMINSCTDGKFGYKSNIYKVTTQYAFSSFYSLSFTWGNRIGTKNRHTKAWPQVNYVPEENLHMIHKCKLIMQRSSRPKIFGSINRT